MASFHKTCFGRSIIVAISLINFPTIYLHSIDEIIVCDFEYKYILRKALAVQLISIDDVMFINCTASAVVYIPPPPPPRLCSVIGCVGQTFRHCVNIQCN